MPARAGAPHSPHERDHDEDAATDADADTWSDAGSAGRSGSSRRRDEARRARDGFDQTTTTHHFRLSRTGGAIEVTANDAADTTAIAQIQKHLQHIAAMFTEGNFSAPMLIHAQEPPGVAEMKRAAAAITYKYEPLPRGGRVQLHTTGHLGAVHEFLRFQITDHRTGDPLEVPPQ